MEKKKRVREFRNRGPAQRGTVAIFKKYLLSEVMPLMLLIDRNGRIPGARLTFIQFRFLLAILILERYDGWATKKGVKKIIPIGYENTYYHLMRKLNHHGMLEMLPPGRNNLMRYVLSDVGYDEIRVFMRLWNKQVHGLKDRGYNTMGLDLRIKD